MARIPIKDERGRGSPLSPAGLATPGTIPAGGDVIGGQVYYCGGVIGSVYPIPVDNRSFLHPLPGLDYKGGPAGVFGYVSVPSQFDSGAFVNPLLFPYMQAGGGDSVLIAPDPGAETLTQPPQAAEDAEALLGAARAMEADTSLLPARRLLDETIFAATFALLGGADVVGRAVRDERDLLSAISLGFPAEVLTALRQAGFRGEELEAVIGPRRTLARRKADGQRLTAVESDAAWRLAHLFALAAHVLKDADVALAWLRRSKTALGDQQPARVANTSVGTRAAERLLMQLEWGDVA